MSILFDTSALDPQDRQQLWSQAHTQIFFPIAVRAAAGDLASSRIEGRRLGPLSLYRVASDPSVVRRTCAGIRASDPELLVVGVPLRGRCVIEQGGRQSEIRRGDLSSWDSSHTFAAAHLEPFELLLVVVPRALLGAGRRDAICDQTARRVPGDSPLGAIAGPFMRQVWEALEADGAPIEDLADGTISLVRALHSAERPPNGVAGTALLTNVKAYIDEHLGSPGLTPASIAQAQYISIRYLHKLFAGEGCTVSGWIRFRRLEACRRDLRDPALAHQTIAEIASRWALTNPAHFSHRFRAMYGCTPSEFRGGRG